MAKSLTITLPSLPHKRIRPRHLLIVVTSVTVIIGFIFWKDIYTFALYRDASVREVQRLLLSVRQEAVLPSRELPGLATVTDKSKLNKGGVLARAENGDEVLLFYQAGQAILYRPSVGKVVSIGPIILDASAAQVKGARILVRNGSSDAKKYQAVLDKLKSRYHEAMITDGGVAARADYPRTIVIDSTDKGSKTQFVSAIDELIDGQNGILPIGENAPKDTDILIIVGKR